MEEVNKYREKSMHFVEQKLLELIPRIKVVAVPETLAYLQRGGRLSKTAFVIGSMLRLKPLISLDSKSGKVEVLGKALGKKAALFEVANTLKKLDCDESYSIVPSYTYDASNLDKLISLTDDKYKSAMTDYDNLDPAIACHWGPCAYGYIFVSKS